jgi:hypothetical protein
MAVIHDTVFSILRGDILRMLQKSYFLNIHQDNMWIVFKLDFNRDGQAFLCDIDPEDEMDLFMQHTDVKIDTNNEGKPEQYILSPAKRELRKVLKSETFTDCTVYYRVSR